MQSEMVMIILYVIRSVSLVGVCILCVDYMLYVVYMLFIRRCENRELRLCDVYNLRSCWSEDVLFIRYVCVMLW